LKHSLDEAHRKRQVVEKVTGVTAAEADAAEYNYDSDDIQLAKDGMIRV
jgi:hypothetical protein